LDPENFVVVIAPLSA